MRRTGPCVSKVLILVSIKGAYNTAWRSEPETNLKQSEVFLSFWWSQNHDKALLLLLFMTLLFSRKCDNYVGFSYSSFDLNSKSNAFISKLADLMSLMSFSSLLLISLISLISFLSFISSSLSSFLKIYKINDISPFLLDYGMYIYINKCVCPVLLHYVPFHYVTLM